MRKLNGKDVFKILRILDAADIREQIKKDFENTKGKTQEQLGADLLLTLASAASKKNCEGLIFEFLASVFEMDQAEVEALELNELLKLLVAFIELNGMGNLKDFFVSAYRLHAGN